MHLLLYDNCFFGIGIKAVFVKLLQEALRKDPITVQLLSDVRVLLILVSS